MPTKKQYNKEIFIALDIDGVLNSQKDYQYIQQNQTNTDKLKFVTNKEGYHFDFVNKEKLVMLNQMIKSMIEAGNVVHIFGISSWFGNNDNSDIQQTKLNADNENHYWIKFFEWVDFYQRGQLTFTQAKNTTGRADNRLNQFLMFVSEFCSNNESDKILIYLDDLKKTEDIEHQFYALLNEFMKKNDKVISFIEPKIGGRDGLMDVHINQISQLLEKN